MVVLAIVGAVMLNRKGVSQIKSDDVSKDKQVPITQKQASFKELLGISSPQKCTFGDANSSGTVYISKNKMRGDFQSTTQGTTINTHMISDGGYNYVWMGDSTSGFKMATETPKTDEQTNPTGVDMNKQNIYSCQSWNEDAGLLTVPATVKFMDFKSSPVVTTPVVPDPTACAACDKLKDSTSKLQCRSALQCK